MWMPLFVLFIQFVIEPVLRCRSSIKAFMCKFYFLFFFQAFIQFRYTYTYQLYMCFVYESEGIWLERKEHLLLPETAQNALKHPSHINHKSVYKFIINLILIFVMFYNIFSVASSEMSSIWCEKPSKKM